ncbi:MAG: hypothetical protein AAB923_00835, partial [Patescibacteria group bacterium]
MKQDVLIVVGAGIAVLVALSVMDVSSRGSGALTPDVLTLEEPTTIHVLFVKEISTEGATGAYASFKKANESVEDARAHIIAHLFGSALYEVKGPDGIAMCGNDFGFGCFHGFFTAGVRDLGVPSISSFDAACVKSFGILGTGCQHGIGHGILQYLGHEKLNNALALCAETTETVPLLGCSSGVFMEYFERTGLIESPGGAEPRPFDPENPSGPCESVPSEYRKACYWALPWWLRAVIEGEPFEEVGRLCGGLAGGPQESCFLGFGDLIASYTSDIPISRRTCDTVAAGSDELRALCRAGAAWHFFAVRRDTLAGRSL